MLVSFCSNFVQPCGIADYSLNMTAALAEFVELNIVPLTTAPNTPYAAAPYPVRAVEAFRQGRSLNCGDICHIQFEYSFWGGIRPLKNVYPYFDFAARVPKILTVHEILSAPFRIAHFEKGAGKLLSNLLIPLSTYYSCYLNKTLFTRAAKIIVHTEEHRSILVLRGVPPERIAVIPHGIPDMPPPNDISSVQSRYRLEGKRIIALLGFISPRKGYELVLDVLPALPVDIVFVIAGGSRTAEDAEYEARLHMKIKEMGLQKRVVVTGYCTPNDLGTLTQLAEIVIAPFLDVSGSGTLSLALAAGKPIIAADIPSLVELKERTGALLLFRNADPADLLHKIKQCLADLELLTSLGTAARGYAKRNSFRAVAERTVALYEEVLNFKSSARTSQCKTSGVGPS